VTLDFDHNAAQLSQLRQEFRTLIGIVLAQSQQSLEQCPKQQMILDKIIQASQQLLADVNQQLTYPSNLTLPEKLASQIRHDLRSRLTVILGYTEMLLEDEQVDQPPGLNSMFAAAQNILILTDKIRPALFA
jgi:K+-sensing histidine kinase KdpD